MVRPDREAKRVDVLDLFDGKLFLINLALGEVTGIVREFRFRMNWSACSRPVGSPAPLGLLRRGGTG